MHRPFSSRLPAFWGSVLVLLLAFGPQAVPAAGLPYISSPDTMVKYTSLPVTSVESAIPQAMIQLSKDHQLFFKAFNDYTDLDGDGVIDISYKHGFDYYGYFDSYKCYTYDTTNKRFVPATTNDQVLTEGPASTANLAAKYCDGSSWSGNFLNWATMTRIDVVRKILFGGKRSIDESSLTSSDLTVLERNYLPNDAHSFAKYYNGSDLNKLTPFTSVVSTDLRKVGITVCNTTVSSTALSQNVADAPLVRVAKGNFTLWAANERWQCRWHEEVQSGNPTACDNLSTQTKGCNGNNPAVSGIQSYPRGPYRDGSSSEKLGEYDARVEACRSGFEDGDRCKIYPNGDAKPIGLFQEYGDSERMWFGMMAGTYAKNKEGGELIKDTSPFTNELNVDTDGRFIHVAGLKNAGGSVNGTQSSSAYGLVNALSLYRITQYLHTGSGDSPGTYGISGNNENNCTWGMSEFKNGTCHNWGNPFGEAYLNVIRYFGNLQPVGGSRANDSTYIPGLNVPQNWSAPLTESNACSSLNIVAFNSSTISYDGDDMDGPAADVADIGATSSSAALADVVGAGEGIHGGSYFVGENGTDNNQTCTAKTVGSLGAVRGLCPEGPRLEGTFKIAGIAWHAHTQDINSDQKVDGEQTVETYAVALASNVPKIEIPVPGSNTQKVTLLPACKNLSVTPAVTGGGSCAIVDFKVVEPHTVTSGIGRGKFYVNWEDSEQGGDFDQDMWGLIEYEIGSSQIKITTDVMAQSTPYAMGFGYILSGTAGDGFHAHSGINDYTTPASVGVAECTNCKVENSATAKTYSIGSSSASLLRDPLWYAAKWGGFTDSNDNGKPDLEAEWDTQNEDGEPSPDGIPDNFFYAVEPKRLEEQLRRVFDAIIGRVASGTAAAVVANAREGEGAVYQALYEPVRKDDLGNEVRWLGTLHSLWVDQDGRLREDDGDAKLEDYGADPAVELFFDSSNPNPQEQKTKVRRFTGDPANNVSVVRPIDELNTLWNARERLSAVAETDTQRSYTQSAANGRYIFTFVDLDQDGKADSGEVQDFTAANFGTGKYGMVNANNASTAAALVNYIRGRDNTTTSPRLRNRSLDYDGDSDLETMRLGDIVQSTPTVVATPAEAFDLLYQDDTYRIFRNQYRNRRNVVYVGANDGMLHAFNAGFFDAQSKSFKTSLNSETAHPLGSELWAYVPYNLLPHLTWLTDPDYSHVWYVDGKPRVFDARVYDDPGCSNATHPCGWATLMVVGLRFGGGDLTLPAHAHTNGFSSFSNLPKNKSNKNILPTRSAYAILDITNPEAPPKLLGEVSHAKLGFATVFPTVISHSGVGNKTNGLASEGWYLVFGNGPDNLNVQPTNLSDAKVTKDNAQLFVLDLKALAQSGDVTYASSYGPYDLGSTAQKSFVGDPVTVDWDLDFKANAVYFSSVGGDAAAPTGKLFKFDLSKFESPGTGLPNEDVEQLSPASWTPPKVMLDPGVPSLSTPTVTFDEFGNRWVYAGTGRLFGDPDKISTKQQYVFGVIDSKKDTAGSGAPMYTFGNLVDVTGARVSTTGVVAGVADVTDEVGLETKVRTQGGWKLRLELASVSPSIAERSVTQMSLLGDILFATGFMPSTDLCGGQGESQLYALYYKTGAGKAALPTFGVKDGVFGSETLDEVIRQIDVGVGLASSPSLHVGGARDQRGLTIFTQTSTGAIERREGVIDANSRSGEVDWRERY